MPTTLRRPVVVGLDVHIDTIMACVYDPSTAVIEKPRQFKNDPSRLRRFMGELQTAGFDPECCYEASSCGYVIYRQLAALGVPCAVIAPTSIPRRAGDRIKTDRRDSEKLATMYANDLLESIDVPDAPSIRIVDACLTLYSKKGGHGGKSCEVLRRTKKIGDCEARTAA